jgi:hypothetical protein
MPPQTYDKFLDEGIDYFNEWTSIFDAAPTPLEEGKREKKRSALQRKALKYFETIDKNRPSRETGRIMVNIMEAWSVLPQEPSKRDWSNVRGYLDELVGHENATPKAKEFAKDVLRRVTREINSWAQANYAQKLLDEWKTSGDIETLKSALIEFKKLERDYGGSRPQKLHEGKISTIVEKFREYFEAEGDRRFQTEDFPTAIESFEKAKEYADGNRVQILDDKIAKAKFRIEQGEILPKARELKGRGEYRELIDLLKDVPENSPIYREAQSMIREARYTLDFDKAKAYYRDADAKNALRVLENKEFYTDPDFTALREKVRKVSTALEAGNQAYADAMKRIREMEDPVDIGDFERARGFWNEVKNLETDGSNGFVAQAQRQLYSLTDEKIGGLYFDKAQALLDQGDRKKGRDFLDLARKYDVGLGDDQLKQWRNDAGRKYNEAINLIGEDDDKARTLLRWILDVLRPGDSEYYEKALKAMASIPE